MKTRKVLSVLLACFMLLSVTQVPVLAAEEHEHDWGSRKIMSTGSCETGTPSLARDTCSICSETRYTRLPAEHKWEETVTQQPTCGKTGLKDRTCSVCGKKETGISIPATGQHEETYGLIPATCYNPQMVGTSCKNCGATFDAMILEGGDPAKGHTFDREDKTFDIVSEEAVSCTTNGAVNMGCKECTATSVEAILAPGHDFDNDNFELKDADCYAGGYVVLHCGTCDAVEQKPLDNGEALGHDWKYVGVEEATCTTTGGAVMACSRCELSVVSGYGNIAIQAPYNHVGTTSREAVAATCAVSGYSVDICTRCGVEVGTRTYTTQPDPNKHVAKEGSDKVLTPADCNTNGVKRQTCAGCGKTIYSVINAQHTWDEGQVTKEPTCGTAGEKSFNCTKCDATTKEAIKATGKHDFQDSEKDATCTENAKTGKICVVCKADDPANPPKEVMDSALDHSYNRKNPTSTVEDVTLASCTAEGARILHCTDCEETSEEAVAPLGHDFTGEGSKEEIMTGDCEATGQYVVVTCARCPEKETKLVEGSKGQHKWETIETFPQTCVTGGSVVSKCSVCGKEQRTAIAAAGWNHTVNGSSTLKVTTVEATCVTTGYTVQVCTVEGCTYEGAKTPLAKDEVNPNAHKIDESKTTILVPGTCTETGLAQDVCELCGKKVYSISPATHTWDIENGKVIDEATCATPGAVEYSCEKCDATSLEAVAATNKHVYENTEKPADCNNPARVGEFCKICGTAKAGGFVEVTGSAALGHSYNRPNPTSRVEETTPASCISGGVNTLHCTDCSATSTEAVGALGHEPVAGGIVHDATSCALGSFYEADCERCKQHIWQSLGDAKEHTWANAVTTVAATCVVSGGSYKICEECGVMELQGQATSGTHAYELTTPVAATCISTGCTVEICKHCKQEKPGSYQELAKKTTHDTTTSAVIQEPTCSENGIEIVKCAVCDKTLKAIAIPATGEHKFGEVTVTKEPTCIEEGEETKTCADCNTTVTEAIPKLDHAYGPEQTEGSKVVYQTCSNCGDIKFIFSADCELAGHEPQPVLDPATDATATTPAMSAGYHCGICNAILIAQKEVLDHEHDWAFDSYKVLEDGQIEVTYKCTHEGCPAELVEVG